MIRNTNGIQVLGMVLISFLIFGSCSEDNDVDRFLAEAHPSKVSLRNDNYDRYGEAVRELISEAVKNRKFRELIQMEALKRVNGDTEFLLGDIVKRPLGNTTVLQLFNDLLAQDKERDFTIADIVKQYPSMIVGIRGEIEDWDTDIYRPA
ncbi:MAG: hypothetical protein AB3N16_14525, partial [Flavobacteriaceae bacterium]